MYDKSKKMNKPFDGELLKRACVIAEKYQIIVSAQDGVYFGRGLEMPFVFGDGGSAEECLANTRAALAAAVSHLLEKGEPVPAPACHGKRTEQINVRLTSEEKTILREISRSRGYKGLGDFIRASALAAIN